jgi:DNA-binding IclR family transcriptional regulator
LALAGLRKMIDALRVVALRDGTTARELGEALGLPKSTVHRLLAGLLEVGLVRRHANADRYVVGHVISELASGHSHWYFLIRACRPEMLNLRDECGETVSLHVLHTERRVVLDQVESLQEHRWVHNNLLVPMPLHAGAASKMLLALMQPTQAARIIERDGLFAFTTNTPRSSKLLQSELPKIRAQGYAMSAQEVTEGIASIAVPVVTKPGPNRSLAVMTVTGPSVRMSDAALTGYLRKLRAAARIAAARLESATAELEESLQPSSAGRRAAVRSSALTEASR